MITYPSGTLTGNRVDGNDNQREVALDNYVVLQYNDQSISGTKTFVSPIVNSPAPTSGTHLTNKNYVDTVVNSVSGSVTSGYQAADTTLSGVLQSSLNGKADTTYVDSRDAAVSGSLVSSLSAVSGSLQTDINTRALKTYVDSQDSAAVTSGVASLTSASGVLQTAINTKAATSYVDTQDTTLSGLINNKAATTYVDSQDLSISGVLNTKINTVSGNLQTDINTRALTSYVNTQDAAAVTSGSTALTSASGVLRSYTDTQSAAAVTSGNSSLTSASGVLRSYVDSQDAAAVASGSSSLTAASGVLQTSINLKAATTYVDSQDLAVSGALNTKINTVSGNLQTDINTRALKTYVDNQDITLSGLITTNTSSIATNTSAIATNTAAIATKVAISGGTLTGVLTLSADPLASGSASNKFYVDTKAAAAVTSGNNSLVAASGVLQTAINLKADTTYVDAQDTTLSGLINTKLAISGGTMTGFITLHANPTSSGHAVTKQYVDSLPVYSGVSSTTTYSSNTVTPTLITGMTITPESGTYTVSFSCTSNTATNNRQAAFAIYSGGAAVAGSQRFNTTNNSNDQQTTHTQAIVSVDGSQAIEARGWQIGAGTLSVFDRNMIIIKLRN